MAYACAIIAMATLTAFVIGQEEINKDFVGRPNVRQSTNLKSFNNSLSPFTFCFHNAIDDYADENKDE